LIATRKYILLGDNTQHDLKVYLEFAKAHPANVKAVIIRQASLKEPDKQLMVEAADFFKQHQITFYYGTELPNDFRTL
jgi:phosphatidate phosphatase APP1